MYLSKRFCFLADIFGCCALNSSRSFSFLASFSLFESGAISAALVSVAIFAACCCCCRCLCFLWRGTNFGIAIPYLFSDLKSNKKMRSKCRQDVGDIEWNLKKIQAAVRFCLGVVPIDRLTALIPISTIQLLTPRVSVNYHKCLVIYSRLWSLHVPPKTKQI